jgi:hypothetical protein
MHSLRPRFGSSHLNSWRTRNWRGRYVTQSSLGNGLFHLLRSAANQSRSHGFIANELGYVALLSELNEYLEARVQKASPSMLNELTQQS